jgi:hypothetical protein
MLDHDACCIVAVHVVLQTKIGRPPVTTSGHMLNPRSALLMGFVGLSASPNAARGVQRDRQV